LGNRCNPEFSFRILKVMLSSARGRRPNRKNRTVNTGAVPE
jgi:hypothetical protein